MLLDKQFNIKFLKEHDYFVGEFKSGNIQWSRNGERTGDINVASHMTEYPYLNINYTVTERSTGEKRHIDYDVRLISKPCYFGGKRWWMQCWNCSRLTSTLYKSDHDKFLCRRCGDLSYESQNKNRRGVWYQVGKVLDSDEVEKLPQAWGKYCYYNGRATKNYRRYLHSQNEVERADRMLRLMNWYV